MKPEYVKLMMMIQTAKLGEEPENTPHRFQKLEVRYMTKAGVPDTRPLGIAIPEGATLPVPVAFVSHYGIDENTVGQHELLKRGIAVAGALNVSPGENAKMSDDDLYYSSACIDRIRNLPELDRNRLIIMGGSAGGYMTMMLTALHLNIAASICISGVINMYFTGNHYVSKINEINKEALKDAPAEARKNFDQLMEHAPFPLHGAVFATFGYVYTDAGQYQGNPGFGPEFSPVYYSDCYSNPVLFTHNTADSLVPIDQITRRYTYEKNGESMPASLSTRMADYDLPPEISQAMDERLPQEQIHCVCIEAACVGAGVKIPVPFDQEKKYNFAICDDGPVEAYYGHASHNACQFEIGEYAVDMLNKPAEYRFDLSKAKLQVMLERYAGISKIFPSFPWEEDTVYGTPRRNQESVVSELIDMVKETGKKEELYECMRKLAAEQAELGNAVTECIQRIEEVTR